MVLKADGNSGASPQAIIDIGVDAPEVWVSFQVAIPASALTYWTVTAVPPFAFSEIRDVDLDQMEVVTITATQWADLYGVGGVVPLADTWYTVELHFVANTGADQLLAEVYVNGVLTITDLAATVEDARIFYFGCTSPPIDALSVNYIAAVKVGSTRGATDYFSDDFSSGNLDAFTSTSGLVSVVADPFPASGTVPDAPSLTGASVVAGEAVLAWEPNGIGGGAITEYRVYRSNVTAEETLHVEPGLVTTYTDTITPFYYQVTAVNAFGESARSNEKTVIPPGVMTLTLTPATPVTF